MLLQFTLALINLSAPPAAWTILFIELAMGAILLVGMFLARRGNYKLHGICQSLVVILNLVVIGAYMWPVFSKSIVSRASYGLPANSFYMVPIVHATVGAIAELVGFYIVIVAGTRILPAFLRFTRYKFWMRSALALWWCAILLGLATFIVWHLDSEASAKSNPVPAETVTVNMKNFEFEPRIVTITPGTTVRWLGMQGKHTVKADNGTFESEVLPINGQFVYKFEKEGRYDFYCALHGDVGGKDMAGTVIVSRSATK